MKNADQFQDFDFSFHSKFYLSSKHLKLSAFCNFSFPFFRELKERGGYLKVGARASNPICPN